MDKEIYSSFIKAEQEGEKKIVEVYNSFYNLFEKDYKKMAELMVVLNNRLYNSLDDESRYILYSKLQARIVHWSNNLNVDTYNKFCELANFESVIKEEIE